MRVKYKEGQTLVLSDALSRLPNPQHDKEIPLDTRVDGLEIDDIDMISVALIKFGPQILEEVRHRSDTDQVLRTLKHTIIEGWPTSVKAVTPISVSFSDIESLAMEDRVIFKGRQVIIPKEYQPHQSSSETMHHDIPLMPWLKVASDIFQIGHKTYLITTYYFTEFLIVSELRNLSPESVANHLKFLCSVFGSPKTLVSDNGPQYMGAAMRDFTKKPGVLSTSHQAHNTFSPMGSQSAQLENARRLSKKALRQAVICILYYSTYGPPRSTIRQPAPHSSCLAAM
ncbi:uncharacterized protein [Palaemon carinicauda]|uniref:uncharacterized protein n=1 Tax=Palaemon carinicauda TaxID=392227 RepID=UPI0035B59AD6